MYTFRLGSTRRTYSGRWVGYVASILIALNCLVVQAQHEHFDAVCKLPNLHKAESLRDLDRYPELLHGGDGHIGKNVFYDREKDSVRFFQEKGQMSLPIGAMFHIHFPAVTKDKISIQWEAMYDPAGFNGGKTYQIAWSPGGDDRLIEVQSNIRKHGDSYRLLHSLRTYGGGTSGGNNNTEQLSTGDWAKRNVQPNLYAPVRSKRDVGHVGEGGRAYYVKPGVWVRYTLSWDLSETPARLKFWIADEETDPTLLFADPDDPKKGFIYEPTEANHGVDHFWFEFNNSTTTAPADLSIWCRNFVVFRGADVPLGGRPSKTRKQASVGQ